MRQYTLLDRAEFAKQGENFAPVSLPHTWNALDGQDGGGDYHRGVATYRILLPAPTKGLRQYVEFRGVNHIATVSCNGVELGCHKGGFSTFRFELTDVLRDADNVLEVDVTNEVCDVYPQQADFTFFGGIYRKVFFLEVAPAHFDLLKDGTAGLFVTPYVSGMTRVDAFPVNAEGGEVLLEVLDGEGSVVASRTVESAEHCFAEISVSEPHLWNGLDDPYLYSLRATLILDGKAVDTLTVQYGYRSYHVDPEKGFFLNGRPLPLHGVCRHQDRENMGWAISEKEHEEDLALIREVGANTIRLAHYQHDSYFYDLCDRAGFVLWAEIPYISKHIPGDAARENTLSQMRELIAQNYNHPAICFWGIANEITIGGFCEEQYRNLCELNALVKSLDPSRPTTMAQLASLPIDSPHNQITDVVSYNIYYGWYKGVIEDNEAFLDTFHKTYPDKAMGISEYGVDNLICWHSAEPFNHDYTEEYACLYHRHMLSVFADRPWLWATHMWNMFDFAADRRAEGGIKGRNCKGLMTYDRKTRKDTFYLYKAFWTKDPCVYVAGRRFANRAPGERTVRVFTNAPEVSLYLNGALYATAKAEACEAVFPEVPLPDGENTVTARIAGAEDSIPLYGVSEHDTSYDLPDVAEALQMGNWFLEEDASKDYGEEGFGLHCKMKEIAMNEEACHIMRGWVMSSPTLAIGEKLHVMSRLNLCITTAPGEKTPRQIKVFAAKCTEEEFATLDKRLRSVKRT